MLDICMHSALVGRILFSTIYAREAVVVAASVGEKKLFRPVHCENEIAHACCQSSNVIVRLEICCTLVDQNVIVRLEICCRLVD